MSPRFIYIATLLLFVASDADALSIGERKMLGRNAPPLVASARERYEEMQKKSTREQAEQELIDKNTPPALTKEDVEAIVDEKMGRAPKKEQATEDAGSEPQEDPIAGIENNPNFGAIGGLGPIGGIGGTDTITPPSDGASQ